MRCKWSISIFLKLITNKNIVYKELNSPWFNTPSKKKKRTSDILRVGWASWFGQTTDILRVGWTS